MVLTESDPSCRKKRKDPRTRRNRTETRTSVFKGQMDGMVVAYMAWGEVLGEQGLDGASPPPGRESAQGTHKIQALDAFGGWIPCYAGRWLT